MEQLPYFYIPVFDPAQNEFILDENTSKHVIQVLRMKKGDVLQLTDGLGHLLSATIIDDHKKKCAVKKQQTDFRERDVKKITIAISVLKNASRFEWFLEKATEIGITEIIPIICERTEKQHFRLERMKTILISAMIQSRQVWLPLLYEPVRIKNIIHESADQQKFIAHCIPENKSELVSMKKSHISSQLILIGPEGDFTKEEIGMAMEHDFIPVALGETRLRSETAAMVASVILKMS